MMRTGSRGQRTLRRTMFLVAALVAMTLLGLGFTVCGGGEEAPSQFEPEDEVQAETATPEVGGGTQAVEIVSKDILFDKSEIRVAGGQAITIRHDNQDDGIPHNIAVYKTSDAKDLIAATPVEPGPVQQELIVGALEPGEYFFRCDTHPTQMTGTLIVEE